MKPGRISLLVCTNRRLGVSSPSCAARGSERLVALLRQSIADQGLPLGIDTVQCFGACAQGPNLRLLPGGPFFHHVDETDLPAILETAQRFHPTMNKGPQDPGCDTDEPPPIR